MAFEMKDRLEELKQLQNRFEDVIPEDEGGDQKFLDVIPEDESDGLKFLDGFFGTVDELNKSVSQISLLMDKIKHHHNIILTSVQNNEIKNEINDQMTQIRKTSQRVNNGLKRLKNDLKQEEQGPNRNTADFRIKKAQYFTLSQRFHEVMGEYNNVQEEYRERCKDRIQRQLKYIGKTVTEDEVEDMIESDNLAIFTQDIQIDTARNRQTFGEVEVWHKEILLLEKNLRELREMFCDMALLVDEQGDLVDCIDYNVENAAVYVEVGGNEVKAAVNFQRKNTKLRWIICCVITTVIVVLVVAIAIAIAVAVVVSMMNNN